MPRYFNFFKKQYVPACAQKNLGIYNLEFLKGYETYSSFRLNFFNFSEEKFFYNEFQQNSNLLNS